MTKVYMVTLRVKDGMATEIVSIEQQEAPEYGPTPASFGIPQPMMEPIMALYRISGLSVYINPDVAPDSAEQ